MDKRQIPLGKDMGIMRSVKETLRDKKKPGIRQCDSCVHPGSDQ